MEATKFIIILLMILPVTYIVGYYTGKLDAEERHAKKKLSKLVFKLAREMEK